MPGNLTFDALKTLVSSGEIDTVLACIVDMQGRLMGKRFHAQHFVDTAYDETHCCNYLLATDIEMYTVEGYASTSWSGGYGDYVMKPDLSSLRKVPWLEATAMVMCDVQDHHTHEDVPHSPRAMLKAQVARLADMGLTPIMATELEFFLFEKSFDEIRKEGFRDLEPISGYNEDYHILQTTKEEDVLRPSVTVFSVRAFRLKTPRARPKPGRKSSTSNMRLHSIRPSITRLPNTPSRR